MRKKYSNQPALRDKVKLIILNRLILSSLLAANDNDDDKNVYPLFLREVFQSSLLWSLQNL